MNTVNNHRNLPLSTGYANSKVLEGALVGLAINQILNAFHFGTIGFVY